MAKTVSWSRISAEAVAIVASILLAFWIDAAWDQRKEEREAEAILTSLRNEFREHRDTLAGWAVTTETRAASLAEGIRIFGLGISNGQDVARLDTAFYALLNIADWDPAGGSLDAAIASGRLDELGDSELQRGLAAWPGTVDDVLDNQHLMQDFGLTVVVPALARKGLPLGRIWGLYRESWPVDREPRSDLVGLYGRLATDPEVLSLMSTKYAFLNASVREFGRAIARAEFILSLIDENLE